MGAELTIYEKNTDYTTGNITLVNIGVLQNFDVIEPLLDYARKNTWCIEGECGATFELQGQTLKNDFKERLEFEGFNISDIQKNVWYECRLSF